MNRVLCVLLVVCGTRSMTAADSKLIAQWPLTEDARDTSPSHLLAQPHNIRFADIDGRRAAVFNGRDAWLTINGDALRTLSTGDYTVSCRVHTDQILDDVPGDLISRFDSAKHQGFHLTLKSSAGVTCAQANWRQLQFGIDARQCAQEWKDHGRPGDALLAFSLCTFNGHLYAATCEPAAGGSGHVYRLDGENQWVDCGSPDQSNSVTSLAEFNGSLYAATGKYRLRGSALEESPNTTTGGRVFRYDGDSRWIDCGQLPDTEAIGGMVVYRGRLYASSLYRPAGFFRLEQDGSWTACGTPERPAGLVGDTTHMRVEAMGVYNGWLWATSYDGGRVFRFDGDKWEDCGQLDDNTQTYAFAVHGGRLYVGTWPSGQVYRYEAAHRWMNVGRLGGEREVMGMLTHNGRLIAGSLPLAEVYEFDGRSTWYRLAQLDRTPDVTYRRAWTMAEYGGRVYVSTLPSGHVYSWRAGRVAMSDRSLSAGWHHVAAVRTRKDLRLYVDGSLIATEDIPGAEDYDLALDAPLQIGRGPNDFFNGHLCDVRLYEGALSAGRISELAGGDR